MTRYDEFIAMDYRKNQFRVLESRPSDFRDRNTREIQSRCSEVSMLRVVWGTRALQWWTYRHGQRWFTWAHMGRKKTTIWPQLGTFVQQGLQTTSKHCRKDSIHYTTFQKVHIKIMHRNVWRHVWVFWSDHIYIDAPHVMICSLIFWCISEKTIGWVQNHPKHLAPGLLYWPWVDGREAWGVDICKW